MRPAMVIAITIFLCARGGAAEAPGFTRKPSAIKTGGKVRIDFASDRETDVTVGILDAKGKVIRHLVSGRLGKNPPPPLKAGLNQSIEWDCEADDGKPAAGGPFNVRVSLGFSLQFQDYMFDRPGAITGGARALGVDSAGNLYFCSGALGLCSDRHWGGPAAITRVYDRDGKYLRTITPFPSNLPHARLKGAGAFKAGGKVYPLWHDVAGLRLLPGREFSVAGEMPVDSKGNLYRLVSRSTGRKSASYALRAISAVDGGDPDGRPFLGPALLGEKYYSVYRQWVSLSSDEKWIYLSGVRLQNKKATMHTVYRAPVDGSGPAKPFIGEPGKSGSGKLLNRPKGVAVDGKGLLYVSDPGNDRVAIFKETDGSLVNSIPLKGPATVQVHPRTGAVYALCAAGKSIELVKVSGSKKPQEVARIKVGRLFGFAEGIMVLDASSEPPVIWVGGGRRAIRGRLLRIEDCGRSFGDPRAMSSREFSVGRAEDLFVDRERDELYVKRIENFARVDLKTGKVEDLAAIRTAAPDASQLAISPDGKTMYTFGRYKGLRSWSRDCKPIPFGDGAAKPGNVRQKSTGRHHTDIAIVPPMTFSSRSLTVMNSGDICLLPEAAYIPKARNDARPSEVRVYSPEGRRRGTLIWRCETGATGPRFDAAGNVYMVHCIKAPGKPLPDFFKNHLPAFDPKKSGDPRRHHFSAPTAATAWVYSSIVKYPPRGGALWWSPEILPGKAGRGGEVPREILALPKQKVMALGQSGRPVEFELQGAEWYYYGVSPFADKLAYGCNCQSARFDVDVWGRSFFPDAGRFRVGVLDTAGNEVLFVGAYGNRDCGGPKSAIPEPGIAFAYAYSVAVSNTHVFVGDHLNHRIARLKMSYAAEETAAIK